MKSYLSLAWKELKAQKVTSVLILIAVILSTAATTAAGQSVGILQTMRVNQAAGLNGNRYATFHQLSEEQNQSLLDDSRLEDVGSWIFLGSVPLESSSLTLNLREYHENALQAYPSIGTLKEGRLPEKPGEIALPGAVLRYLGFGVGGGDSGAGQDTSNADDNSTVQSSSDEKVSGAAPGTIRPGDTITLPVSVSLKTDDRPPYEYTAEFVLTGILEDNYVSYVSSTVDAVIGEGTAAGLLPERYFLYSTDFKTKSRDQFQSIIWDLSEALQVSEDDIQYNWILLDALGISYEEKSNADTGSGFPFMAAACVLVGVLILLAAGLVIYNILKVAVTKRIREYGTLRAIGSEQSQLYLLVTVQLLILCGIGLPPGLLLGGVSAKGILTAALGMLNPDLFLAENTQELNAMVAGSSTGGPLPMLLGIFITLLFAVLAAFPSARYASRVSPTAAMSGQAVKIRRRHRKQKKIRSFEAFYAGLNLKRNRGRTAVTILSIVMSITVFVALQSFSGLLDASQDVQDMHIGDYAVSNEAGGISPEAVNRLKEQEMISEISTEKLTVYEQDENGVFPIEVDFSPAPSETFQIGAVDQNRLESMVPGLSEQDIEDLRTGAACLAKNPIAFAIDGQGTDHTELHKDDRITVDGTMLRIAGILNNPLSDSSGAFLNGVQIVTVDSVYDSLTGNGQFSEVYLTLAETADAEEFEAWLDTWCAENPGSRWLSYREADSQMAESFEQIRLLCWGLILFIGLIGILNIVNTVYTNIHTRIHEIGMQRAIGMSSQSLYKTFLWEGAYYGLIASGIGGLCGYICTVFVEAAATDVLRLTAVPVAAILEAAAVSVAACLAATAVPLYGIGKMSIVDSIETVE